MNPHLTHHELLLILDFGSQYTQLLARRAREQGVFSRVISYDSDLSEIFKDSPKAIVLSGGPHSVYDPEAPNVCDGFWEEVEKRKTPLLGICYGMQLLAKTFGGKVERAKSREYGKMSLTHSDSDATDAVWMSHGDHITKLPEGFKELAKSKSGSPAIMKKDQFWAYQFHPEVTHSEKGKEYLRDFFQFSKFHFDWKMRDLKEELIERIRQKVGVGEHVICALSGGVDSTVAAALVHEAIGDRLHCLFVDHGLLRFDEQKRVRKMFEEDLHLSVEVMDASEIFYEKLKGITDPEKKRKVIGAEFIACFEKYANTLEKKLGSLPKYLVQGTLYPDVIESAPPPSLEESTGGLKKRSAHTIKSHHNVGGLPKDLRFELVEPFRALFKDEVREMGRVLGIKDSFIKRHPFPGPGLAVRILGEVNKEKVEILQKADEIFISMLKAEGLYDQIWQAFAVFLPIQSVGVQGDGRTHDFVVALRAVTSVDGMTADWFSFSHDFLSRVSSRICNEVDGIGRVVYDVTSKPPGTIEWE